MVHSQTKKQAFIIQINIRIYKSPIFRSNNDLVLNAIPEQEIIMT